MASGKDSAIGSLTCMGTSLIPHMTSEQMSTALLIRQFDPLSASSPQPPPSYTHTHACTHTGVQRPTGSFITHCARTSDVIAGVRIWAVGIVIIRVDPGVLIPATPAKADAGVRLGDVAIVQ